MKTYDVWENINARIERKELILFGLVKKLHTQPYKHKCDQLADAKKIGRLAKEIEELVKILPLIR